jgi:hypothetical protein
MISSIFALFATVAAKFKPEAESTREQVLEAALALVRASNAELEDSLAEANRQREITLAANHELHARLAYALEAGIPSYLIQPASRYLGEAAFAQQAQAEAHISFCTCVPARADALLRQSAD